MSLFPENRNDSYTHPKAYEAYHSHTALRLGQIVNVTRKNHLSLNYEVELMRSGGVILKNCKVASSEAGFNGTGVSQPLNEGTPVLVLCDEGMLQDALIVGCFNTEGNYQSYYQEGKLQAPGELEKGALFNQPLGHPNRITQEDSYFHTIGGKTISSQYDSPEYYTSASEKAQSNPLPSSIELRNQGGDVVQYTVGSNIQYTEGNLIQVSGGDREQKTTKLLRFAAMHSKRAQLLEGKVPLPASTTEKTSSGITPLFRPSFQKSYGDSVISDSYRATQERKLAQLYTEAAKNQSQLTSARLTEANRLQSQFGSELGKVTDPKLVQPNWNPKTEKAKVDPNNYGERLSKDINNAPLQNQLLVVLHETVISANAALGVFSNPTSEVSYHALIKRDGTIVELVAPNFRAYGAANSSFNGESATLSSAPASVNNFAYHISLESPADGNFNASSHSGYTDSQYQSLAYLVSRTGVQPDRITTHAAVDRTGERQDPRSFNRSKFDSIYAKYPHSRQLNFGPSIK